jgi:hypothetical protein
VIVFVHQPASAQTIHQVIVVLLFFIVNVHSILQLINCVNVHDNSTEALIKVQLFIICAVQLNLYVHQINSVPEITASVQEKV